MRVYGSECACVPYSFPLVHLLHISFVVHTSAQVTTYCVLFSPSSQRRPHSLVFALLFSFWQQYVWKGVKVYEKCDARLLPLMEHRVSFQYIFTAFHTCTRTSTHEHAPPFSSHYYTIHSAVVCSSRCTHSLTWLPHLTSNIFPKELFLVKSLTNSDVAIELQCLNLCAKDGSHGAH